MDSSKHTPGNWSVGKHSGVVVTDNQEAADLQSRDSKDSLDWYGGPLICESCRNADAKLIAAAPDLLEALTEIFNHEDTILSKPIFTKARLALVKAKL